MGVPHAVEGLSRGFDGFDNIYSGAFSRTIRRDAVGRHRATNTIRAKVP